MNNIGIDVGSTYVKYCIINAEGSVIDLSQEKTPVRQTEYFEHRIEYLHKYFPHSNIVCCGYGKHNIKAIKTVTELTALSVGLHNQCPNISISLDIGGQDTKIIYQENGKLKAFFINDKCAAGSGLFLTNVLNILNMRFDDIDLSKPYDDIKVHLPSVCAIFAQSRVVELIAANVAPEAIIRATLRQIFTQASTLINKIEFRGVIALSGALGNICGVAQFISSQLKRSVIAPKNSSYLSAIGCALIAEAESKLSMRIHG